MANRQNAKELFKIAASTLDYSDGTVIKEIYAEPDAWEQPCDRWTSEDVESAKKTAARVIRNQLPFSKRYPLMEVFNAFMTEHFQSLGYSPLLLEKLTERAEVEIELLKLLQGGTMPEINSRSREAIAELMHFTPEALKPYLARLKKDKNLLGSKVSIKLQRKTNVYDSTIHPVFLALNLTEVNFLVNHLRLQFREYIFRNNRQPDRLRRLLPAL